MEGNALVPIVMFGWVPLVLMMFAMLPPVRAVVMAFVGAWLFLPVATVDLPAIPDYTKMSATSMGVLLGTLIFHPKRFKAFKFRPYDIPMLLFCVSPAVTAVLNFPGAAGFIEAKSMVSEQVFKFGFPYFIGRIYFCDRAALRELAIGLFVGGILYMPLCLYEVRMSPTLHSDIYGFRASAFGKGLRYGGYRPLVFMWTYLALVMFMTLTTAVGFWLWRTKSYQKFRGFGTGIFVLGLVLTLVLCKTYTAALLLPLGIGLPILMVRFKTAVPLLAIAIAVPMFMGIRATGMWKAEELYETVAEWDEERALSLQIRIDNENRLAEKAMQQPIFGWGGWGRSRVKDEDTGEDITTADGLWIVVFGQQGVVGLVLLVSIFLTPIFRFVRNYPAALWDHPQIAGPAILVVALVMTLVNNVPNSTLNPIMTATIGGLSALPALGARRQRPPRRPRRIRRPGGLRETVST